jgi:DNA-binding transcriptional regulator GbsR (MarR family)
MWLAQKAWGSCDFCGHEPETEDYSDPCVIRVISYIQSCWGDGSTVSRLCARCFSYLAMETGNTLCKSKGCTELIKHIAGSIRTDRPDINIRLLPGFKKDGTRAASSFSRPANSGPSSSSGPANSFLSVLDDKPIPSVPERLRTCPNPLVAERALTCPPHPEGLEINVELGEHVKAAVAAAVSLAMQPIAAVILQHNEGTRMMLVDAENNATQTALAQVTACMPKMVQEAVTRAMTGNLNAAIDEKVNARIDDILKGVEHKLNILEHNQVLMEHRQSQETVHQEFLTKFGIHVRGGRKSMSTQSAPPCDSPGSLQSSTDDSFQKL